MIYRETINVERIALSPVNDISSMQSIELIKFGDACTFGVLMNESERYWEFDMAEPSDYERVKMNIYDAIFECDTMEELGEALDAIFENGFGEILIFDSDEDDEDVDCVDSDDCEEDEDDEEDNSPYCNCPNCRKYRH